MTSVAQAVAANGMDWRDDEDVVLTVIAADGQVTNHTLEELGEEDVATFPALYQASGTFAAGSVHLRKGRTRENVSRVLWLIFDCDLVGWMNVPKEKEARDRAKADLWAADDASLEAMLVAQRQEIQRVFGQVGIPIHRLDVTGYGHCAYVRLDEADQERVTDASDANKDLIKAINAQAGCELVDPQASDPGPRITRLPGSYNCKGAVPRLVHTVFQSEGSCPLGINPRTRASSNTPIDIPDVGRGLSDADCRAIVAAVSPLWGAGARNGIAFGLGGMFAKARLPESQAVAVVTLLADGDDELADRLSAVRRSYAKVRQGKDAAGFTWLRNLLTETAIGAVDGIVDRYRQATAPRIIIGSKPSSTTTPPLMAPTPPPKVAFRGWFGEYRDLMGPTTEAPDAFHLGSALSVAGAMLGRRVTSYQASRVVANIFAVLVGDTGRSRKDTAMSRAIEAVLMARPDPHALNVGRRKQPDAGFLTLYDVTSSEGLVGILSETPNILLYMTEFSILLRRGHRESTSTLLTMMTKLWDAPSRVDLPRVKEPLTAERPFVAMLTATTPDTLADDITADDVVSGFANRLLFFGGAGIGPKASPPRVSDFEAMEMMDALRARHVVYADGHELPWASDATTVWTDWYDTYYGWDLENDEERHMAQRLGANICKVALIYATADGAKSIQREHIDAAIAVVSWCWTFVRQQLNRWGQEQDAKTASKLMAILARKGAIHKRLLQQSLGARLGPGTFVRILEAMVKSGQLLLDSEGVVALAGEDERADTAEAV